MTSEHSRIRILIAASVALVAMLVPMPASGDSSASAPKPKSGVWLAGDLHIHTCFSHDSYCGPDDDNTGPEEAYTLGRTVEEQFCDASRRALDFLAITDHNDVRSQKDPGWGACGVLPIPGYENSLQGHAQMLGATEVYEKDGSTSAGVNDLAARLRADGGTFQINHPAGDSVDWPNDPDWKYGYDVPPDTVETWNISTLWQPPAPSGSSNDDAIRYWEGWLDRGYHVGATGGADNHYKATAPVQGPGQPTTWVYAADRSQAAILEGLRAGRTTISHQAPGLGGPRLFLEADADGDGSFESMVGDTVPAGATLRARVLNAPGAELRMYASTDDSIPFERISGPVFEHRLAVPAGATWIRAEVVQDDRQADRQATCDEHVGDQTTYCRSRLLRLAMSSAIFVDNVVSNGEVYVRFGEGSVTLGNSLVERAWTLPAFGSGSVTDKRTERVIPTQAEFELTFADGIVLDAEDFQLERATASSLPGGGIALTMVLGAEQPNLGRVIRTVSAYPGIAGFQTRTAVQMPGVLSRYVLDGLLVGQASPQIHAFRAGYDWRGSDSPDWQPQLSPFGDHHSGDHRVTTQAGPGEALEGEGEWLSMRFGDGSSAFLVMERVNYASSRMRYGDGSGQAVVDLEHDLAYLGPFESDIHVGNPGAPVRYRTLSPQQPLDLESVFVGLAVDADDEPWQHWKYLDRRSTDWDNAVVFNSNGVDANRISTGAKDDMDFAEVQRQAAVAKRLGVETFILDDGWQARSGDWCPDSPECPEPRWDGTETSKFKPRFPDAKFEAVREAIAPMELGLWMTPMHFNPSSSAYGRNPQWNCEPVGEGLVAANRAQPDSSSNEAGLGTWNPEATGPEGKLIDYIEGRVRRAVEEWQVRYFKFDFLVWLDCAGVDTVTAYDYRESFIRMLDRLIASYPDVTFQIDETNDYRLFPFESAYRGPSWYANGSPKAAEALHNLWVLSPYVPGYTIGQTMLGQRDQLSADYLMAVSLASHMTFFTDLTQPWFNDEHVATVERWTDLYKENRERFATFAYPLLDDPLPGNNWTALQPWNSDTGTGALLVYRQDSPDETRTIPLKGVRGNGSFRITNAETGEAFGEFTAQELRSGISVSLPQRYSARVLFIDPV